MSLYHQAVDCWLMVGEPGSDSGCHPHQEWHLANITSEPHTVECTALQGVFYVDMFT